MTEKQEIRVRALECTTRFLQYTACRNKFDLESAPKELQGKAMDLVLDIAKRFETFILDADR